MCVFYTVKIGGLDDFIFKVNIWHILNIWHIPNTWHIPNRSLSPCLKEGCLSVSYSCDFLVVHLARLCVTLGSKQTKTKTKQNKTHDWPIHFETVKKECKNIYFIFVYCFCVDLCIIPCKRVLYQSWGYKQWSTCLVPILIQESFK